MSIYSPTRTRGIRSVLLTLDSSVIFRRNLDEIVLKYHWRLQVFSLTQRSEKMCFSKKKDLRIELN